MSNTINTIKIIKKLCDEINQHNIRYYCHDNPIISDYEYDILLKKLIQLESLNPKLVFPESPTQRVGAKPLD